MLSCACSHATTRGAILAADADGAQGFLSAPHRKWNCSTFTLAGLQLTRVNTESEAGTAQDARCRHRADTVLQGGGRRGLRADSSDRKHLNPQRSRHCSWFLFGCLCWESSGLCRSCDEAGPGNLPVAGSRVALELDVAVDGPHY